MKVIEKEEKKKLLGGPTDLGRPKVHEDSSARQVAYRKRRAAKLERYEFALRLLTKAMEACLTTKVAPGLAAEIKTFLGET